MPNPHRTDIPATNPQHDPRSRMARAADARPPRPYAYGGETEEPPAVRAARERWRAIEAGAAGPAQQQQQNDEDETMPEGRWPHADGDTRSAMARVAGSQPLNPYVYRGTGKDLMHGATGTLDDVRRMLGRHEESAPDPGPDPLWYRELAEDDDGYQPCGRCGDRVRSLSSGGLCDGCAADDTPRPALAAVPDPDPDPEPGPEPDPGPEPTPAPEPEPVRMLAEAPAAARCPACGYPPSSIGHRISCGDDPPTVTAAPSAPPVRCKACGYLTGTVGHKVACDA